MYNNSYMGSTYSSPNYNPYTQSYMAYQQPQVQRPSVPQEIPFNESYYGTMKEAEAHIVAPTKSVLFFNRGLDEIYVKSADNMGNPVLETFKKEKSNNLSSNGVSPVLDTKDFVKMQDLEGLATKDDLKEFLTADNTQNFVTKDDIKVLTDKIEQLQKQVKINAILKGEEVNGK